MIKTVKGESVGRDNGGCEALETIIRRAVDEMGFSFLPFGEGAVGPFSQPKERIKAADAIHLACAASAGIDLFLTGDKRLLKLHIPGIQFVADLYTPLL